MKRRIKITLMLGALLLGLSVTAGAQVIHRTPNGGTVTVYPNGRRVYHPPHGGRIVTLPNGRRVYRSAPIYTHRAWTYRTRDGRLVTVLPHGRRIYH
jgi:hypothetical protein